jgi:hypothetical protein
VADQIIVELPGIDSEIASSAVLTGGKATVKRTDEGVMIDVPAAERQDMDTIVVLKLSGSALQTHETYQTVQEAVTTVARGRQAARQANERMEEFASVFARAEQTVRVISGVTSVTIGLVLAWEVGTASGFFG